MPITFIEYSSSFGDNSNLCVIPRPTNLVVGNLMVAHCAWGLAVTIYPPNSSWIEVKQLPSQSGYDYQTAIFYKVATASDVIAPSFTFSASSSYTNLGAISTFSGQDRGTPIADSCSRINYSENIETGSLFSVPITNYYPNNCMIAFFGEGRTKSTINDWTLSIYDPGLIERYNLNTDYTVTIGMACAVRYENSQFWCNAILNGPVCSTSTGISIAIQPLGATASSSSSSISSSSSSNSSSSSSSTNSSSSSSSMIKKIIKFGLVTDLHYADIDNSPPRYYRDSLQKLTDAVNVFNNVDLSFVICLGDFIDDNVDEPTDLAALNTINTIYENCIAPRKYFYGNRDMVRLTKSQFEIATGMPSNYYSFDVTSNGYTAHFVVLDCMYRADGSDAEAGNFDVDNPIVWISDAEETWLTSDLNANLNKPTYILAHYMVSGSSYPPPISISNSTDIMSILEGFSQVQAVFNGHLHENYYEYVNGIHYVTFDAVVNNPYPSTAYAIIELCEDLSIVINGYGDQTSYNLSGRQPASSSSSSTSESSSSSSIDSSSSSSSESSSSSHYQSLVIQTSKYESPWPAEGFIQFNLDNTPQEGNILLAFTLAHQSVPRNVTPPDASWTNIDTIKYGGYIGMDVWWHKVVLGDGTSYTFNISGLPEEFCSGILYEVTNIDATNPIDQHGIVGNTAPTVISSPIVTPSVLNTFAISACCTCVGFADTPPENNPAIDSGWILGPTAVPQWESTFGSYRNSLTTDITTPISNTFTFGSPQSYDDKSVAIVLLVTNP